MDANRVLGPGESILIMGQGRQGKTVGGTRVFQSWHDFQEYAMKHFVSDVCNKPVGSVVGSGTLSNGRVLTVIKQGYVLGYGSNVIYVASDREDPKRFKLKLEDLGLTEGKYDWVKPSP